MNILIVDDDPDILEVIELCLETNWPDATLLRARNGSEALQLSAQLGMSLVILDLGLPDIDGLEVCRQIREKSDVPVLILTVRDRIQDAAAAEEAGASAYLTKPFSTPTLVSHVKHLLESAPG